MAKDYDTFTKHWDEPHGYTQREAEERKAKIDEAYGTESPNALWHPAQIVPDPCKKDGFMIKIERK